MLLRFILGNKIGDVILLVYPIPELFIFEVQNERFIVFRHFKPPKVSIFLFLLIVFDLMFLTKLLHLLSEFFHMIQLSTWVFLSVRFRLREKLDSFKGLSLIQIFKFNKILRNSQSFREWMMVYFKVRTLIDFLVRLHIIYRVYHIKGHVSRWNLSFVDFNGLESEVFFGRLSDCL